MPKALTMKIKPTEELLRQIRFAYHQASQSRARGKPNLGELGSLLISIDALLRRQPLLASGVSSPPAGSDEATR